ncbi:hypothetical protein AB0O70_13095 [Microbacterium paraoxydans]|jgi:cell division protein ZapA (FtsZ GTPase activity inhibitor)|uniref:hypothetical protein n=1 Tax=Microbacterium paraoxydans TaxID=199592 RepID=UPI00343D9494
MEPPASALQRASQSRLTDRQRLDVTRLSFVAAIIATDEVEYFPNKLNVQEQNEKIRTYDQAHTHLMRGGRHGDQDPCRLRGGVD